MDVPLLIFPRASYDINVFSIAPISKKIAFRKWVSADA